MSEDSNNTHHINNIKLNTPSQIIDNNISI